MPRILIQPGEKLPLRLTAAERKLILEEFVITAVEFEEFLRETPPGKPVLMTLGDLDDFGGHVAAEANHCPEKKKQKKLDAIYEKVQDLLDRFTDEPPATIKFEDAENAELISAQATQIATWAASALASSGKLRIKTKPLERLKLAPAQRDVLLQIPGLSKSVRNKLAKKRSPFTVAEAAGIAMAAAEGLSDADPKRQAAMLLVVRSLIDCLEDRIAEAASTKKSTGKKPIGPASTGKLFQFKITLLGAEPAIWRRIQVEDCTLDKLHEHIQTTMGWTNSHLHQFEIDGERYGDPELLDDGFERFEGVDSRITMVSEILPAAGKPFAFRYEYDFGDGWEHEILFEGHPPKEKGKKYPLCLEGERACPPEDVGGVWGYHDFLAAIADPRHEEHESFLEWCGGSFSSERFDPKEATRGMKKGLLDWRNM